jgi:transcriptional regulator with XRE-family HTH domain
MAEDPKPGDGVFAERLNALFRTVHPPGGKEYSNREVVDAIAEAGGPRVSSQYLQQLRNNVKDNPSMRLIVGLADFFGVKPAYFFSDKEAQATDEGVALLLNLVDAGALNIATRLPDLPPESRAVVAQVVEHLRHLAGLPDAAPGLAAPPNAAADTDAGTAGRRPGPT